MAFSPVKIASGLFLTTILAPVASHAQVVASGGEPADTIDSYPAFVLEEPVVRRSGPQITLQLASDLQYSSNILGVSNLPGGLELPEDGGTRWNKSATVLAFLPVSSNLLLYANAGLAHSNSFKYSQLNHFILSGGVGALYFLSGKTTVSVSVDCASERDSGFDAYYELCMPSAGFTTAIGNPYSGTGLELGVRGGLALGDQDRFGRYREASVHLNFETGRAMRFQFRPEGRIRGYDVPTVLDIFGDSRTDYQASLRAALFFRGQQFTFGIAATPRVNWSNMAQYRYWEVQGGPFVRVRF